MKWFTAIYQIFFYSGEVEKNGSINTKNRGKMSKHFKDISLEFIWFDFMAEKSQVLLTFEQIFLECIHLFAFEENPVKIRLSWKI